MVQVNRLSKGYQGTLLFSDLSFSLQKGEKCGLLGRNGSGKTTLLKILCGKEEADSGTITLPKGYQLGYLEQHSQFLEETVLEEALRELSPEQKEASHLVEKILFGLGFDKELLFQDPQKLSGGFHLRLKLAKVLSAQPNCLLLDEPTNYLDIVTLKWLRRYLSQWNGECLIISHDRDFLDGVCSHMLGIHRKKAKKVQGNTESYFAKILEEEELYEKTRANLEKKRMHAEEYIRRFGAKASKASQAQSRAKALARMPSLTRLASIENLDFTFQYSPFAGKKMLSAKELSFSYHPDTPLIDHVSLDVEKGKRIAIIGKNGIGKSTLLKLLAGELKPLKGSLSQSEQVRFGYFGQTHIDQLNPEMTIEEEIAQANPQLSYMQARTICGQMMFSADAAKKKISVLSGGERSRVLLGKILATPSNLLLLDEPTHHLDMESIEALIQAIDTFPGAVIIVTHSEWVLDRFAADELLVFQGKKQHHFLGSYEEFLEKSSWEEQAAPSKNKVVPIPAPISHKRKPKALEKEISSLEKAIEDQESLLQAKEKELAQAASLGLTEQVIHLSRILGDLQEGIEKQYKQLDILYLEKDSHDSSL